MVLIPTVIPDGPSPINTTKIPYSPNSHKMVTTIGNDNYPVDSQRLCILSVPIRVDEIPV